MERIIYKLSKNFTKNLKNERLIKKLTQKQIALMIGIKTQSYQAYESGITMPTTENLLKLCVVLNITPNDLFEFDDTIYI